MTAEEIGDDPFPSLDEAFARRVQQRLDELFGKKAPQIAWDDWLGLKPYLAAYKCEAEYVRGYLNKGEAQLLRDISKRAKAMLVALTRANGAGLGKPIASVLEPTLLDDFQNVLRKIAEDFALEGEIAPDFPDMSRANLFWSFEAWWKRSTEAAVMIEEGSTGNTHPTPFMFVANEVFNLPGMPTPTGASYKSLKDFRRADRDRYSDAMKLAEALEKHGLSKKRDLLE